MKWFKHTSNLRTTLELILTHLLPMHPFSTPKNIRKPYGLNETKFSEINFSKLAHKHERTTPNRSNVTIVTQTSLFPCSRSQIYYKKTMVLQRFPLRNYIFVLN